MTAMRWLSCALLSAAFVATVGFGATHPRYRHADPQAAQLTVSFTHAGARVAECRRLGAEEIAALAANMKRATECPRARVPLAFALEIDGEAVVTAMLPPTGVASDGRSSIYRRIALAAGPHRLTASLRDTRRDTGFDWQRSLDVVLAPRQNFTIDFEPESGGFVFK